MEDEKNETTIAKEKEEIHEDYVARKLREKKEREANPVEQEDCGCGG